MKFKPITLDSGYVQKAQKQTPYSTLVIGGAKELAEWKAQQKRLDEAYARAKIAHYEQARASAVKIIQGGKVDLTLSAVDLTEIEHRRNRSRSLAAAPQPIKAFECSWDELKPSKSLYDRFTSLVSNIWTNAFRQERE